MSHRSALILLGALAWAVDPSATDAQGKPPALVVSVASSLADVMSELGAPPRARNRTGRAAQRRRLERAGPADRRGRAGRSVRERRRCPDGRRRARRTAGCRLAPRAAHQSAGRRRGPGDGTARDRTAVAGRSRGAARSPSAIPRACPAGVYARQWLERAGIWAGGCQQGGAHADGARRTGGGARRPRRRRGGLSDRRP